MVNNGVPDKRERIKLERCPDKSAGINLRIITSLIGEINDYENVSQTTHNISNDEAFDDSQISISNSKQAPPQEKPILAIPVEKIAQPEENIARKYKTSLED